MSVEFWSDYWKNCDKYIYQIMNIKTINIVLTFFFFTFNFFAQEIKIPLKEMYHIQTGDTVYVKRINYFDYKGKYIVDTLFVANASLYFHKKEKGQFLYVFSTHIDVPITYIPLLQAKEQYTYMFCSNFYAGMNYLLLDKRYNKYEHDFLKEFYVLFTKKSFDQKLYKQNDYKLMPVSKAENLVADRKNYYYKKLAKKSKLFTASFIDYIKTEIELGSINQFLNWYEDTNREFINQEFEKKHKSPMHEKYYTYFLKRKWNKNSIQYFRLVERIVNYRISKQKGIFKNYYKESETYKKDSIIRETTSDF